MDEHDIVPAGILIVCDKTTDTQCDKGPRKVRQISNQVALVYTIKNKEIAHSHNKSLQCCGAFTQVYTPQFQICSFLRNLIVQNKPTRNKEEPEKTYLKGKVKNQPFSFFYL